LNLMLILLNAVVAEIAERRRLISNERREALFYAGQGLVVKLAMAGGSALVGLLLHYYSPTAAFPGGLRAAYLAAGGLLLLSTIFFNRFLKLKSNQP